VLTFPVFFTVNVFETELPGIAFAKLISSPSLYSKDITPLVTTTLLVSLLPDTLATK